MLICDPVNSYIVIYELKIYQALYKEKLRAKS